MTTIYVQRQSTDAGLSNSRAKHLETMQEWSVPRSAHTADPPLSWPTRPPSRCHRRPRVPAHESLSRSSPVSL